MTFLVWLTSAITVILAVLLLIFTAFTDGVIG